MEIDWLWDREIAEVNLVSLFADKHLIKRNDKQKTRLMAYSLCSLQKRYKLYHYRIICVQRGCEQIEYVLGAQWFVSIGS